MSNPCSPWGSGYDADDSRNTDGGDLWDALYVADETADDEHTQPLAGFGS